MQLVEPAAENDPVPHTTGLIMPEVGHYHPAGHVLQVSALWIPAQSP